MIVIFSCHRCVINANMPRSFDIELRSGIIILVSRKTMDKNDCFSSQSYNRSLYMISTAISKLCSYTEYLTEVGVISIKVERAIKTL